MKYIHLLLLFFSLSIFAQKTDLQYSKAKIFINSNSDITHLMSNGINADEGIIKQNTFVESVFSNKELEKAKSLGYRVSVLIEDMQAHYLKNIRYREAKTTRNPEPCSDTTIEYDTPVNFNLGSMGGFLTYSQIIAELDDMQTLYPNLITVKSPIGSFETIESNPIYWVKISDNPNSNEAEPEILYTAIHHAREPASMQQLIYYMWYLLENYNSDTAISTLVDNTEMYFVPVINVDGYQYNESTNPNGGGYWRKNRRDNGDGTFGVDLNRNYGYEWGGLGTSSYPGDDTYPGTEGFSEPETQAIKWFCEQHEFTMAINNHTHSELLLFPFGYDYNQQTPDHATFEAISALMVSQNGYTNQISADLYAASGVSDDWMYGDTSTHNKIFAMTPEIGDAFWPSQNDIIPICKEMMFHNLTAATLIHNYGEVTDEAPLYIASTTGSFDYSLTRLGLGDPGDFTVSISPISTNILTVGTPNTHNGLAISDEVSGSISFTLGSSIQLGDEVSYKLIVDNGLFSSEKVLTKIYGNTTEIFYDSADIVATYWDTANWGISTTSFVSSPASITDSPSSEYGNYLNESIVLSNPIDLEEALIASVSFFAKWDVENNYDYVQFEVSSDNGTTWEAQCGNYTNMGVMNQNAAYDDPLYDGVQADWVLEEIDLSAYIGQQILFRFVIVSDSGVTGDGFYIDDLSVKIIDASSAAVDSNDLVQFNLFPNPAGDVFQIQTPDATKDYVVQLLNITGQVLRQYNISGADNAISIQDVAKGVYLVKIFTEGSTEVIKLIKK